MDKIACRHCAFQCVWVGPDITGCRTLHLHSMPFKIYKKRTLVTDFGFEVTLILKPFHIKSIDFVTAFLLAVEDGAGHYRIFRGAFC